MKKFNSQSLIGQALLVYLLSFSISLIFFYPFDRLYSWILKPAMFGGLFFPNAGLFINILNGTLFAYYFFLPLFIFSFIRNKQWIIWLIGAAIPLLIALTGGVKDLFWAVVLSAAGWVLAKAILWAKNRKGISNNKKTL